MFYKLKFKDGKATELDPLPFLDFAAIGKIEKDLEELLSTHLLDTLFEGAQLMPIFQERQQKSEADLYALDITGNLVIFELKRGSAGPDAMLQVLRYGQSAGQWTYNVIEEKYRKFCKDNSALLAQAHKEEFGLERGLLPSEFNREQRFIIVGNSANDALVNAVDYWKQKGLSVDFLPYRVFMIGDQHYFEFFALPYDRHHNPAFVKGVLFDTNRSWNEESIWEMMEKKRVAAYGSVKHVVGHLKPKDIVFFSHKKVGIVAAAEVLGPVKDDGSEQQYRDVKFLTTVPSKASNSLKGLSYNQVFLNTGKTFFHARTIKYPYLTKDEAIKLLDELKRFLG